MSKDLDKMLDECIDRMNEGESLEECLASYPEHAQELSPLLRAVRDVHEGCSPIPRATAKSAARQRLDAALVNAERSLRKPQRRPTPLFGWSRVWATVAIALVVAVIGIGLYWILTPGAPPVVVQPNFRLLLSDEENAIGDFTSLEVTITSIGVLRGGEGGGWEVIELEPSVEVDLTDLPGLNAQEIWSGRLSAGEYTQVFIYIDDVSGTINGKTVNVKLPSGNLQISKPFEITADDPVVSFVYDVTVVAAGDEYVLLPQVDQSGANREYHEVGEGELSIQAVQDVDGVVTAIDEGVVTRGEEITVLVTFEGKPVAGATVTVKGDTDEDIDDTDEDVVYETDAKGLVSFTVPIAEEIKIKAEIKTALGELKGKLRIDFGDALTLTVIDHGTVRPGTLSVDGSAMIDHDSIIEGDVHAMGNIYVDHDSIIQGGIYANGNIYIDHTVTVEGDVYAIGNIELNHDATIIQGSIFATGDIYMDHEVVVGGDAYAMGNIELDHGAIIQGNAYVPPGKTITVEHGAVIKGVSDDNYTGPWPSPPAWTGLAEELEGEFETGLQEELEGELTLQVVVGEVAPGEEITVLVTHDGNSVPDALVMVNDEEIGWTDGDGLISFIVPDEDKLEIEAVKDELKGELEIELEETS